MAGIYSGDPNVGLANRYGLDFTFNGPPFGIGEIGYRRNQAATDASVFTRSPIRPLCVSVNRQPTAILVSSAALSSRPRGSQPHDVLLHLRSGRLRTAGEPPKRFRLVRSGLRFAQQSATQRAGRWRDGEVVIL